MASKLQQALETYELVAQSVAHAYMEERQQQTIPGETPLTHIPLDMLLKDIANRGAIPTVMAHPVIEGSRDKAAVVFGIYYGTLSKRIKTLKIDLAPVAA